MKLDTFGPVAFEKSGFKVLRTILYLQIIMYLTTVYTNFP